MCIAADCCYLLLCVPSFSAITRTNKTHTTHKQQQSKLQWLLGVLLSTVARPGAAQQSNPKDDIATRTCVSHILRSGLGAGSPEPVQLSLARALVKLLSADSNLNSLQLQLGLVEVSNLTRTLGDGTAVFAEALIPRLLDLLRHFSYGVRFEAAVTLEAVCHSLPHTSSVLLSQTISAVRTQYEALAALAVTGSSGAGGNGGGNDNSKDDGDDDTTTDKAPSRTSSPVPTGVPPDARRSVSHFLFYHLATPYLSSFT